MSIQLADISHLIATTTTISPNGYSPNDTVRIGNRMYRYVKMSGTAVRGNLVFNTTTDGTVSTTYLANQSAGYVVAATVASGAYCWVQTWGPLMYDSTHTFTITHSLTRTAAIGDRITEYMSGGMSLIVSAGVALTSKEVGTMLGAILSNSATVTATAFATISS